jgi:tetratricopeptide (TPR) repeat protein
MKYLLLILIVCPLVFAQEIQKRRAEIIKLINLELSEIVKIVKRTKGKSPNFILRMGELHFERARILKEQENERFLRIPIKKRIRINKQKFFSKSHKSFQNAQKAADFLLKNYPNYAKKGDVYYILAQNALKFQKLKSASRYFSLAKKYALGNQELEKKVNLALAQENFNKKLYARASSFYQKALKGNKDRWYTKDAYNLSWCYFRIKKYDQAISLMREIHHLSKNPQFINMKSFVERDLAFFYVKANRVNEAVSFYESEGLKVVERLIKVGDYLLSEQKYTQAQQMYEKVFSLNPTNAQKVSSYLKLLKLYEKYGKSGMHIKSLRALFVMSKKGLLSSEDVKKIIIQAKKYGSKLQKQAIASKRSEYRKRRAKMAINYFNILSQIDLAKKNEWIFLIGETYYLIGNFQKAITFYDKSFTRANQQGDTKLAQRSIKSLISSLGKKGVPKKIKDKYISRAFLSYLKVFPKGKTSFLIYQRAFNIFLKVKESLRQNTYFFFLVGIIPIM